MLLASCVVNITDAAEHPAVHRAFLPNRKFSSPDVNSTNFF